MLHSSPLFRAQETMPATGEHNSERKGEKPIVHMKRAPGQVKTGKVMKNAPTFMAPIAPSLTSPSIVIDSANEISEEIGVEDSVIAPVLGSKQ